MKTVDANLKELEKFGLLDSSNNPLIQILSIEDFVKSLRDENKNNTATLIANNSVYYALSVKEEGETKIGINTYLHFRGTQNREDLGEFIKNFLELKAQIKNAITFKPVKNYLIFVGEGQVTPKGALELTFDAVVKGTDLRAFGALLRKVTVYCIGLPLAELVSKIANLMSVGKNVTVVQSLEEAKELAHNNLNSAEVE